MTVKKFNCSFCPPDMRPNRVARPGSPCEEEFCQREWVLWTLEEARKLIRRHRPSAPYGSGIPAVVSDAGELPQKFFGSELGFDLDQYLKDTHQPESDITLSMYKPVQCGRCGGSHSTWDHREITMKPKQSRHENFTIDPLREEKKFISENRHKIVKDDTNKVQYLCSRCRAVPVTSAIQKCSFCIKLEQMEENGIQLRMEQDEPVFKYLPQLIGEEREFEYEFKPERKYCVLCHDWHEGECMARLKPLYEENSAEWQQRLWEITDMVVRGGFDPAIPPSGNYHSPRWPTIDPASLPRWKEGPKWFSFLPCGEDPREEPSGFRLGHELQPFNPVLTPEQAQHLLRLIREDGQAGDSGDA